REQLVQRFITAPAQELRHTDRVTRVFFANDFSGGAEEFPARRVVILAAPAHHRLHWRVCETAGESRLEVAIVSRSGGDELADRIARYVKHPCAGGDQRDDRGGRE